MHDSLYDYDATTLLGEEVSLNQYNGKVSLVVNTASLCGFTPQYTGLQELYETYRDQGLEVLGFPSNDFGAQEPGSNQEIHQFCEAKKVQFPLFEKNPVLGAEKQPIYSFLTTNAPDDFQGEVKWNFEKFLVNKKGEVVGRYPSSTKPSDATLRSTIEAELKKSP